MYSYVATNFFLLINSFITPFTLFHCVCRSISCNTYDTVYVLFTGIALKIRTSMVRSWCRSQSEYWLVLMGVVVDENFCRMSCLKKSRKRNNSSLE